MQIEQWEISNESQQLMSNEHPSTRKTAERTKIFKGEVIVSLALSSIQGEGGGGRQGVSIFSKTDFFRQIKFTHVW